MLAQREFFRLSVIQRGSQFCLARESNAESLGFHVDSGKSLSLLCWFVQPSSRMTLKRKRAGKKASGESENEEKPVEEERTQQDFAETTKKSAETEKGEKSPVVVFAHGAGAPSSSEWMIRWKIKLAEALNAVEVVTFDYPYLSGGKRGSPPKAEKLFEYHCNIVRDAMAKYPGHPLVLAGKSMGSRVSCMVACERDIFASAIVCLGYPLKGMNGTVRDEILLQLTVPVVFVQGSKDGLCPLEKLEAVMEKMKSAKALHVINGGDHSFKIGKKFLQSAGSDQEEEENLAAESIAKFISTSLGES